MNDNEFSQQFPEQKTNIEPIDRKAVSETKSDQVQTEAMPIPELVNYGVPTSIVLIGAIVFLNLLKAGRHGLDKIVIPTRYFSQVPCRKCRFFASNPYLKCAIHPSTVLTAQARNCSDYWSLDGKFSS